MKNINKTTVVSTAVGMGLFGLVIYLMKRYGGATGAQIADTVNQ